jgi:hypothetical protein
MFIARFHGLAGNVHDPRDLLPQVRRATDVRVIDQCEPTEQLEYFRDQLLPAEWREATRADSVLHDATSDELAAVVLAHRTIRPTTQLTLSANPGWLK